MKTLIVLGAANIFLGFASFVLSNHVEKTRTIEDNNSVIATHKRFVKPIKHPLLAAVANSACKKLVKIKTKIRITRKKTTLPVFIKANAVAGTKNAVAMQKETGLDDYNYMQLIDKAEKLEEYAKLNGYSTEYGFLINMGMKSGKKRFFVIDLSSMVIIDRGIVSHGRGREPQTPNKTYSNVPGSNCTSLGIYEVGKSDTSVGGASYKLYGLQESNSNASKRSIVLHAMDTIPENEMEHPIFQSKGSPTISNTFLNEVSTIIKKDSKPVLMWIFDTERESELLSSCY
ncbi:hypothetical protein A4H97_28755 [Niastella yeongjuensis]|uniref:Uncharacterized protein n=1 Tax=Niastella yeongjuensis TaxID=354355 RepID=A0A1V9ETH5_9BACT|nr:murein L,D-transpeptidase catalytic domain family protein [Niastella yeongjuensis]OQP49332.1 hypothetical protein A4H97_28755 [Niastella yeongjuensis]SEP43344.1 L,D-transpeptidase catalytic domain [Niastella yeongjuensis]